MHEDKGLDLLGRRLTQSVRDVMISYLDAALSGQRRDIYAKQLYVRSQGLSEECRAFVDELVPFLVDGTLETFLQVLDVDLARNGERQTMSLRVRGEDGQWLDVAHQTDGLEAEYGGRDGWVERFSQQRPNLIQQRADRQAGIGSSPSP